MLKKKERWTKKKGSAGGSCWRNPSCTPIFWLFLLPGWGEAADNILDFPKIWRGSHISSTEASSLGGLSCSRIGEVGCMLNKQHKGYGVCPLDFRLCACIGSLEKNCHILTSLEGNIILGCNQVSECVCRRSWETGYQQGTAVQSLLEKDISEQRCGEYLFWKEWFHPDTPWTSIAVVSCWRRIEYIGGEQNDE